MEFTQNRQQPLKVRRQGSHLSVSMEFSGQLLQRGNRTPKKRAAITTFSKASQKRMKEYLSKMKFSEALFITLTARKEFDFSKVRSFLKRLYKVVGNKPVIWKKEYQKRGVVHYHLLVINCRRWITKAWIQRVWSEIITDESIVHITYCKETKKVINYLLKYLAKQESGVAGSSLEDTIISGGRFWGIENRKYIKWHEIIMIDFEDLSEDEQNHYFRLVAWLKDNEIPFVRVGFIWWRDKA